MHGRQPPRSLLTGTLFAAALAMAGCSLAPPYERPESPVPAEFPGVPAEAGANAGAQAADIAWREFIAEPRLASIVELALENSPDLRAAALRVEQAQAQLRSTRSGLFPSVDLRASSSRDRFTDAATGAGVTTGSANVSVGMTAYELDFFGRVRNSTEQALEQYLATDEARRSAQITLVAEVATQYFALREAEEQLRLARDTLALVEEALRLNQLSYDVGEIDALDLRTAEGQLQAARVNVVTYERQATQAENLLVLLVGAQLPEDLPAPSPFGAEALAAIPAGLSADLLERRPDILEAEHALRAANANIGAARAALFPTINLTASAGRTSDALGTLVSSGSSVASLAPQLVLSLFDAGARRAGVASAEAGAEIEAANYERAIETAFREVADALVAADTYAREVDAQALAIDAQSARLTLADARYRQGEDAYLTVLSAQQDLYSAEQARLRAQLNRTSSQIALYRALGGGWQ